MLCRHILKNYRGGGVLAGKTIKTLKSKRGETLIFSMLIIVIAILFTALLVDFGLGFSTRFQVQSIAYSMAIGGASHGMQAFRSLSSGKKTAIVDQKLATAKAQELLNANKKFLPGRTEIVTTQMNPAGKRIDGKTLNSRDQYYSGNFTVRVHGRYRTMFIARPFGGSKAQIPNLNLYGESRVKVSAE